MTSILSAEQDKYHDQIVEMENSFMDDQHPFDDDLEFN